MFWLRSFFIVFCLNVCLTAIVPDPDRFWHTVLHVRNPEGESWPFFFLVHCIFMHTWARFMADFSVGSGLLPQHGHHAQGCQATQRDDRPRAPQGTPPPSPAHPLILCTSGTRLFSSCSYGLSTGVWLSSTTLGRSTMSGWPPATSKVRSCWWITRWVRFCWLSGLSCRSREVMGECPS